MGRGKWMFMLVLLAVALAGGTFLAGWLTRWLLGLGQVPLAWNTWWQYVRVLELPQYAPFGTRIRLAGAVGFGVPLLAWMALVLPLFRRKAESLHGDARFATFADLRKAGLLKRTPQSILIGRYRGRYLWLGGAQHVIAISPTRSGKTTSIAIPVLLTWQHSMVVLDIKGELHKATSGWRAAQGHAIRVWAPYDDAGHTHRFNPMTALAGMDPGKRLGELQTIAAILYPDGHDRDPFWTSQARAAFTAFASFLFESWDADAATLLRAGVAREALPDPNASPKFPSFERVLRFSSGDGRGIRATLEAVLTDPRYGYVSPQTRSVFGNLCALAKQTFSSVLATLQAPLQQFLNPILAAATNATDFDLASLRKRPATLYVIIPANKLDESGKLLNIFFSSAIGANLDRQLGETPDLKHQVLMLMDEFTAMGRVDAWAKRISVAAGYGVRDLCIVQSRAQLRSAYGHDDAENFITNHAAQIVFAPREQEDANAYSEMLGYKTVRRKQRTATRGGAGSNQASTHWSEDKRALFLPQEIKELPPDDEIIFHEGSKPIRAQKNWFFRDRALRKRAAMEPVRLNPASRAAQTEATRVVFSDVANWRLCSGG